MYFLLEKGQTVNTNTDLNEEPLMFDAAGSFDTGIDRALEFRCRGDVGTGRWFTCTSSMLMNVQRGGRGLCRHDMEPF